MYKIAVVSGDTGTLSVVTGFLRLSGFETFEYSDIDPREMLDAVKGTDLCILDTDRLFLLNEVLSLGKPVILMGNEKVKMPITTIEKPFSMARMLEIIHSKLVNAKQDKKQPVTSGIDINDALRKVTLNGEELPITSKEFDILMSLVDNPEKIFTREDIIKEVWGDSFVGEKRTVDSHVARLRTKLKGWGETHIKTVYGKGYIFSK